MKYTVELTTTEEFIIEADDEEGAADLAEEYSWGNEHPTKHPAIASHTRVTRSNVRTIEG